MTSGRRTAPAALRAASALALVLAGVLVLGAGPAAAASAEITAAVCPEAPPGMQAFADDVTAWVKWGVLALIGIGAVVSLGSILVGRIFSHPHASRYGAMGIAVVVMVAISYTAILTILGSITGSGCT
ncbi:hypothetical protein SAMN04515665_103179 [Blastococcus sp. DSM 46786]|uniref:hypothetical protein n=1 Tax=Blastococcus sp. DSM 46786 TaxID=1798227 RepID=UPI0008D7EF94|nr:hypothetical protein [Blastococcus sp. DSM 46786]SEK61247.1 hypothetical protein SAMN04515665_103179 [Blastococcus sp. DSM 46786]